MTEFKGWKYGFVMKYASRYLQAARPTILILLLAALGPSLQAQDDHDIAAERKQLAERPRRIIMNNDGNDVNGAPEDGSYTIKKFLDQRTSPLADSQVDAIFYCDGIFNVYTHQSAESELRVEDGHQREVWGDKLYEKYDRDPLRIICDFGHRHGMEVFWSMRMNDTHDTGRPEMLSEWKKNHRDLMMAPQKKRFPYGGRRWTALDYGKQQVRDKVFRILEDVATRYDVDGLELDFFRHPVYFKPQMTGAPVTKEHCDQMTALLSRVREMADRIGRERGRPILISVRVPDSVGFSKAIGLDLVEWLEQDLVDLLVGGGYLHLQPWENWVALGERYDVPVYACLSASRLVSPSNPEGKAALPLWRGEALRAWRAGVDGIYTFNRFDPTSPLFHQLGNPDLLASLPHEYRFIPDGGSHVKYWLKDGSRFLKK